MDPDAGQPRFESNHSQHSLEAEWAAAIGLQQEIEFELAERQGRRRLIDEPFNPEAVVVRLNRLADVLASDNATLGNLEISLHIDRIDCFQDGRILLRTCKLGLLGDTTSLLVDTDAPAEPTAVVGGTSRVTPRRRARLRTEGGLHEGDELKAAAYTAADPNRFLGLPERWFCIDEFQIPDRPASWVAANSEAVFRRRQETKLSFAKLAIEFGVTPPTIRAAIDIYLAEHPGLADQVCLPRGGKRPKKFDLSLFADEARRLWQDEGWSKLGLAAKYGCSTPTIDKALAFAYQQDGLPIPKRENARDAKVAESAPMLDVGRSLDEIAKAIEVSDSTAREYLQRSFAAEGRAMPDRRRRRIA